VVWAAIPVAAAATVWFWPKRAIVDVRTNSEVRP